MYERRISPGVRTVPDRDLLAQGRPGDLPGEARYMAIAVLAGTLADGIGSIFHLLVEPLLVWPQLLERVFGGWMLVGTMAMATLACTIFALVLVRRFAPEAGGSGVQEIEGAMEGLRPVRWRRVLPVKFIAGVVSLGPGLVLGREGPTIHLGASAAAAMAEFFRTSELERRGLLASGPAAGLACAFNAPLAAVLFIIEETHKKFPYTFRTYLGVIFAAVAPTIGTQMLVGTGPVVPLAITDAPLPLMPAFPLLGIVLDFVGVALNKSILWAVEFVPAAICARPTSIRRSSVSSSGPCLPCCPWPSPAAKASSSISHRRTSVSPLCSSWARFVSSPW